MNFVQSSRIRLILPNLWGVVYLIDCLVVFDFGVWVVFLFTDRYGTMD